MTNGNYRHLDTAGERPPSRTGWWLALGGLLFALGLLWAAR
jgi:hypothetical protein